MTGQPARGITRTHPPFEPGNVTALKHGAHSPRQLRPIAEAIAAQHRAEARWTATPAFATAVESFAWAQAQAVVLRAYLDEHGMLDDAGQPRPAAALLGKVEGRLLRLRGALGLDPQSLGSLLTKAASVAATTGDDGALEALRAEGRALLATRAPELEQNSA